MGFSCARRTLALTSSQAQKKRLGCSALDSRGAIGFAAGALVGSAFTILLIAVLLAFLGEPEQLWRSIEAIGTLVVFIGLLIALWQYRTDRNIADQELLLSQAQTAMERVVALFGGRDGIGPPPNNRFMWLTAARLLLTAEDLALSLSGSRRSVFRASKQYHRAQLIEICEPLRRQPQTYWANKIRDLFAYSENDRPPISPKSAKVVFDWLYRKGDDDDPLDKASQFSEEEIEKLQLFYWRGLGDLLENYREELKRPREKSATAESSPLPDDFKPTSGGSR